MNMKNTIDYIYSKGLYNELKSIFDSSFPYAVIKGKPLSLLIYNNVHERIATDIDILCAKSDCNEIIVRLRELGFSEMNKNRFDILFSKCYSHQYVPMVKINKYSRMTVDLNFDILWGEYAGRHPNIREFLSDTIVVDIYGIKVKTLSPLKAMVQLLLHHFKEMNSIYHITSHNCITYSMFKDVYYLWKNHINIITLDKLYTINSEYEIIPYVFYVLYFTNEIFKDANLAKYVEAFQTSEGIELLNCYGLTKEERKYWKIDFSTRLKMENLYHIIKDDLTHSDLKKLNRNRRIFG